MEFIKKNLRLEFLNNIYAINAEQIVIFKIYNKS